MAFLSGNIVSCPECGGDAKTADGVFSYDQVGTPRIVQAPPETHLLFGRIYKALREAKPSRSDVEALIGLAKARQEGALSPDEAEASADKINPNFRALFSPTAAAWYAVLLAALAIYMTYLSDREDDAQHAQTAMFQQQMLSVAEEQLEISKSMRDDLRALAASRAPVPKIVRPPEGHRTKRQARRDRKYKLPSASSSKAPATPTKRSKTSAQEHSAASPDKTKTTKAAPDEPERLR